MCAPPTAPAPEPFAIRHTAWLLAAMVLTALLLRLPLLGRSVWFDEACMSDQRIGTWPQLLATLYVDIHPPLFAELLRDAALVVRRSLADPNALELPDDRPDDVCYLVRDHWHPHVSVDGSVEALLAHPAVELLEQRRFAGVSVYKIRLVR